uniref:NADH-ubiquinone oxidoreductase chain 5 n=1 Tax=Meghimatium bilineatum TaxID=318265 RepID=A0A218KBN9_9EUPU|nr:NADH dehydrogenase subunit 5 [Meghimatium bilineatum]AKK32352.1 NADH dehydrogenase subunit 5 [Meghimatium bilineatum]
MMFKNYNNSVSVLCVFGLMIMLITTPFLYWQTSMIISFPLYINSSTLFSYSLCLDWISLSFSSLVFIISMCVFSFSCTYMKNDPHYWRFTHILSLFVLSMNFLIYSASLFALLIGWDGLGLVSFLLIIYYSNTESFKSGFLTLLINRFGDLFIVAGVLVLIQLGNFNLYIEKSSWVLLCLLVLASLTKSAQYPFSAWLPAAMAAPTPVSALVHSSTLVTAGVYLLIRLSINSPLNAHMTSMLCFLGSLTCLLGGYAAMYENDLKKIIALSTLSQLGLMIFSLSIHLPYLALFHLYMHAIFKALLFICAGHVLILTYGLQDLRLMGGILLQNPFLSLIFSTSALALVAFPFLNSFYSKHLILDMIFSSHVSFLPIFMMYFGSLLTGSYLIRMLFSLHYPSLSEKNHMSMSWVVMLPMLILSFLSVVSGHFCSLFLNVFTYSFLPKPILFVNSFLVLFSFLFFLFLKSSKSLVLDTLLFSKPLYLQNNLTGLLMPLMQLEKSWLEPNFKFILHYMTLTKPLAWLGGKERTVGLIFLFIFISLNLW